MSNETLTRCALVTGGSRGIGRAVCLELARAGFAIAVNYAGNQQAAQETAEACRALGVKAEIFAADVSRPEECARLFEEALAAFGRVDVLVNNAGVTRDSLILRLSEEDFDKVLDTNLKGAFFCCKAAARPMMKQRFGRIINLTSVVGLRGNPGQTNYSASKAGLIGLTKSLAKELASRGITANAVAPGFIDTDMTRAMPEAAKAAMNGTIPLGRPGQPEEVARAVAFFASEESGYITGQVLCVDGGMAM
ncbi:MAG: 3-oxoacyl-[acyl-carrier-protein] reductase [Bacteroidales bacterium]|nr:3-oxoacyl-[acyl-carrier-protein] reductase [Bacteroidales bacterium]